MPEWLEDQLALFFGEPNARIGNAEAQRGDAGPLLFKLHLHPHRPGRSELHRVIDQVEQHLAHTVGISQQVIRRRGIHCRRQCQPFVAGHEFESVMRFRNTLPQRKGNRVQLHASGLDLREIQDVIQQPQQRVGGRFGDPQMFALFIVQMSTQHQTHHAQHTVHRRSDFMTHVRQKLALGAVGLFSPNLGFIQLGCSLAHLAIQIRQKRMQLRVQAFAIQERRTQLCIRFV